MATNFKRTIPNYLTFTFFLFFSCTLFGQTKVDKILSADKFYFLIETSGCFGGGADTITIVRQSSDSLTVFHKDQNGKIVTSTIDQNQLLKFGETFKEKMNGERKCGCTLSSTFVLSSKNGKTSFHTSCCGEELPSKTFRKLLNTYD